MPREFKQRAKFKAVARCLVSRAGTQFASASLDDLKVILPADYDKYSDLLPIAGNVAVANMGNDNGDLVDTEVALAILPKFLHKCVNVEHNPTQIVGHLTTSGLTAFSPSFAIGSGSQPISAEDVKGKNTPFNIAVGGFIYKDIFDVVAEKVIEANDPNSPTWLSVAFSWELSFDENKLLVGSREIGDGQVIDDAKLIEEWRPRLKCNGGSGLTPDGKELYRLVCFASTDANGVDYESVTPEAVALTLAPAGDVAGILVGEVPIINDNNELGMAAVAKKDNKSTEIISQYEDTVVTPITKNMKTFTKLEEVLALDDESAKQYSFANVKNVVDAGLAGLIADAVQVASNEYETNLKAQTLAASQSADKANANAEALEKVQAALATTQASLAKLEKEQKDAQDAQTFNERMSYFDEKFELEDADRKAIASVIQGLDNAAFEVVKDTQLQVLLASKNKEDIAKAAQTSAASAAEIAQKALASATVIDAPVTSSVEAATASLREKFAKAFDDKALSFSTKR